jgi:hypothetical protein
MHQCETMIALEDEAADHPPRWSIAAAFLPLAVAMAVFIWWGVVIADTRGATSWWVYGLLLLMAVLAVTGLIWWRIRPFGGFRAVRAGLRQAGRRSMPRYAAAVCPDGIALHSGRVVGWAQVRDIRLIPAPTKGGRQVVAARFAAHVEPTGMPSISRLAPGIREPDNLDLIWLGEVGPERETAVAEAITTWRTGSATGRTSAP